MSGWKARTVDGMADRLSPVDELPDLGNILLHREKEPNIVFLKIVLVKAQEDTMNLFN